MTSPTTFTHLESLSEPVLRYQLPSASPLLNKRHMRYPGPDRLGRVIQHKRLKPFSRRANDSGENLEHLTHCFDVFVTKFGFLNRAIARTESAWEVHLARLVEREKPWNWVI